MWAVSYTHLDAETSQKKMKELKSMKDDMETYHNLVTQMDDMETMIEMGYEENDPDLIPEIQEMLEDVYKRQVPTQLFPRQHLRILILSIFSVSWACAGCIQVVFTQHCLNSPVKLFWQLSRLQKNTAPLFLMI